MKNKTKQMMTNVDLDKLMHDLRSLAPSVNEVVSELKEDDCHLPDTIELCEMIYKRFQEILKRTDNFYIE